MADLKAMIYHLVNQTNHKYQLVRRIVFSYRPLMPWKDEKAMGMRLFAIILSFLAIISHSPLVQCLQWRTQGRIITLSTRRWGKNLIRGDQLAEIGAIPSNSPRIKRVRARTSSQTVATDVQPLADTPAGGKRLIPQGKPKPQELNNPNKLRILGGRVKGRKIDSPDVYLRPMMSKVREAVFSTLTYMGLFAPERGTRVLDIFAGAGSVGLESLSRGAAHATFVDLSSECTNTILNNAMKCGFTIQSSMSSMLYPIGTQNAAMSGGGSSLEGEVRTVTARAEEVLGSPLTFGLNEPFDFISLTPPYREVSYPQLLSLLCTTSLLAEDGIVLVEYPLEMGSLPPIIGDHHELVGLRNRRYGRTVLAMYVSRPRRLYDLRPMEFQDDFIRRNR